MTDRHRVVFTPSGREGTFDDGATALDAARELGVDLDSVCGGRGICGRCQVVPTVGALAKWQIEADGGELSPVGPTEAAYKGRRPIGGGARLGCQAAIRGDVVLDVPPESQLHAPVIRKDIDVGDLTLDPVTTLHAVYMPDAELGEDAALGPTVMRRLAEEWGVGVDSVSVEALRQLHAATSTDDRVVTAAVRRGPPAQVVRAWPGVVVSPLGIAIDIGSTTIAGHAVDLSTGEVLGSSGRMNPQIRLGEDLMSRVSYVMMNPGGDRQLTDIVREALAGLIDELSEQAGAAPQDVLEIVLVGNPIMHHIALGIDPTPLGQAPFVLATDQAVELPARDLDLPCPSGRVWFAPCVAGHVGADTAAVILAEGPHRSDELQLLVDVGTNAEIVLGNAERLYAASSPTGPAFEGAQISCGQRATPGAIERVRIDPATFTPRLKVVGCDLWSDEPGFAEATAATGVTGICGSGIIEVLAEMYLVGVMSHDGVIDGSSAAAGGRIEPDGRTFSYVLHRPDRNGPVLRITQNDVRAVQLAKAALRAGIDLLMEHAGITDVADIRLAGAFGAHIDPLHALVLGLVPDAPLDGVRSVGNAAGAGAVRALLSAEQRRELIEVVGRVHKIETATEPRFQELFVGAMALPHATAPTSRLAQVVELPERPRGASVSGRRGRRRRGAQSTDEEAQ